MSRRAGNTLKVALSKPDCEFDLKTAQPVFSPVPAEAGAASNTKYNDEPIGNGPFMMSEPVAARQEHHAGAQPELHRRPEARCWTRSS